MQRYVLQLAGFGGQTSIVVTVHVKDSNDHSPLWAAKWMRQGPIAVPSDAAVGTLLLKVTLTKAFIIVVTFFTLISDFISL